MLNTSKLTMRQSLTIASLIFGMLFGAGNLIFPVHLGQMAGSHWVSASMGFLVTGVLLPLLALLAISITRSDGIYDLTKPVGHHYALVFLVLILITLGPFSAEPRTATVPYTIGVATHLATEHVQIGLLIFTAIFFALVYAFSVQEGKITEMIGKILNPVFLVMLFVIFTLAFIHPLGNSQTTTPTTAYMHQAFTNGFLQGYNTMDTLAMLMFGITIITAIREMGVNDSVNISWMTIKSGTIGVVGIGIIYLVLIWLGATSLHQFAMADNGGVTLQQIAHYYMGLFGDVLLAVLTTVTCLSTAMGIAIAFSQEFHQLLPQLPYKVILGLNCLLSFLVANLGLDQIITWSTPILTFLYPLAIMLVILGILSPFFSRDRIMYQITMTLILIPAVLDLIVNLPAPLSQMNFVKFIVSFSTNYIPFFADGFGWLTFGIAGLIIGGICHIVLQSQK